IRAAVVPDHDVALAPRVAVLTLGLDAGELVDERVTLRRLEALDPQDLARIEIERLASGLGMGADDRMEDRLPVAVLGVEQRGRLATSSVGEGADSALELLLEPLRQRIVGRVHAREQGVAAPARNGQRVELRGLERLLIVRAVGVPSLGA